MKPALRIVIWYVLLIAPLIAALYTSGAYLSSLMALAAAAVISIVSLRNIAALVHENRRQARQILEADRMKKDFISQVSHELKAPLASMQETSQLMLERIPGPLTAKQERLLNLNLQSGKRLAVMIGNLLDISRLQAGIVEYEMQVQDLAEIARGVVAEHAVQAREKAIQITTQIADEPVMVRCDPNRIVQVFSNLVDNAVRFSPKGGAIHLSLRCLKERPPGAPYLRSNNGYVLLSVGDSGPGIETPNKTAVFDAFHQMVPGKKTLGQSLGLGLAISRALVRAHGGVIWVEDNACGGSLFFVLLPRSEFDAVALSQAS